MPVDNITLPIFIYGEQLDPSTERSLGYQLLEPVGDSHTTAQIDELAKLLQTTPYPDHWPEVSLFCSILLDEGQRLIAVAGFGVVDHTSSHRRGGIELFGVVAPHDTRPAAALSIYRWLQERRAEVEDLRDLGGAVEVADLDVRTSLEETPASGCVLPVRCWRDGCMVFSAPSPTCPDQQLALLEQVESDDWQWLPLCAGDFPFSSFAARGPLIAWTQDLASVGVRLDRHAVTETSSNTAGRFWFATALAALLVGLLGANLYALITLPDRLSPSTTPLQTSNLGQLPSTAKNHVLEQTSPDGEAKERFAVALYELLQTNQQNAGVTVELKKNLLLNYHRLAKKNGDLKLESEDGQKLVGMISIMSRWNGDSIAKSIVDEFTDEKTVNQQFIKLISERVRNRFLEDFEKMP